MTKYSSVIKTAAMLINIIVSAVCLFSSSATLAGTQVKFSIIPLTPTTIQIPANATAQVQYRVTNNTTLTRTLTMVPILGVNQTTTAGSCAKPFTLRPKQSCILTLQLQGNQLPKKTLGGPQICKTNPDNTPSALLCSQPSLINRLNISVSSTPAPVPISITSGSPLQLKTRGPSGTFIITNNSTISTARNISSIFSGTALAGKVTQSGSTCANLAPGASCTLTYTPGVSSAALTNFTIRGTNTTTVTGVIGVKESLAYVVNFGNNTVSVCPVNNDGSLGSCTSSTANGTLNLPVSIAINASSTVAYITNYNNNRVSVCDINAAGLLINCVVDIDASFNAPTGISLNPVNETVYVANYLASTVSICPINPTSLDPCTAVSRPSFNQTAATGINPARTFLYVTNEALPGSVSICQITSNSIGTCTLTNGGGTFAVPQGISFNATGTHAYVGLYNSGMSSTLSICNANSSTGDLTTCSIANGPFNFSSNVLIALFMSSPTNIGYIPNNGAAGPNSNSIARCAINTDGSLGACTSQTDPTFNTPSAIVLI